MSRYQLEEALIKLEKALNSLKIMIDKPIDPDRSVVDSVIKRFEFTIELFWKFLKRIVEAKGIEVIPSPRDVLKEAYVLRLIDDELIWLNMIKDRNRTAHIYNEEVADEIYEHIKKYYPVLRKTFDVLSTRLGEKNNF